MTKRNRKGGTIKDPRQLSFESYLEGGRLLELPKEPQEDQGVDQRLRRILNEEIQANPLDREQIADYVSGLAGRRISKAMLDSYTGASRPNRLPADLLPALTVVLGIGLIKRIAQEAGCHLMERNEVAMARLGQVYLVKLQAEQEIEASIRQTPLFRGVGHG